MCTLQRNEWEKKKQPTNQNKIKQKKKPKEQRIQTLLKEHFSFKDELQ